MSQAISIAFKPKILDNIIWRWDGEDNQIIILSKDDFALPLMLNPAAAKIFSLSNGSNTLEDIARVLCAEFKGSDFPEILADVKKQVEEFIKKEIVEI